jgi:hypothetical protein
MTTLELYYMDAALAFDPNYCTAFSPPPVTCTAGYTIVNPTGTFLNNKLQATFMNDVGQGTNCSPPAPGPGAGNCAYAATINAAHGLHAP